MIRKRSNSYFAPACASLILFASSTVKAFLSICCTDSIKSFGSTSNKTASPAIFLAINLSSSSIAFLCAFRVSTSVKPQKQPFNVFGNISAIANLTLLFNMCAFFCAKSAFVLTSSLCLAVSILLS